MAGLQRDEVAFAAMSDVKKSEDFSDGERVSDTVHYENEELDGIHDGLTFPTEEELETLRRVPDTIPWNAYRELVVICSGLAAC